MAFPPHVRQYADFTQKVLALAAAKSGSWSQLCRDIPVSTNHMYRIRTGKARLGADIMCALLEHVELMEWIDKELDETLAELGVSSKFSTRRGH